MDTEKRKKKNNGITDEVLINGKKRNNEKQWQIH